MPRILVAEDDSAHQRLLKQTLEHDGHEVIAVQDGAEAIAALQTGGEFDVVITDYTMPIVNGIEIITVAQQIDPNLPCIIVTAFRDLNLAMDGMQAGATGFIPKPFSHKHLLKTVN